VEAATPSDPQVTHIRLYRTQAGGVIFYRDQDIPTGTYLYGVCFSWEKTDSYISGDAWKFTISDSTHSTENTFSWEKMPGEDQNDNPSNAGNDWFAESNELYNQYVAILLEIGAVPLSYEQWLETYT
jgi:hypothetical protein